MTISDRRRQLASQKASFYLNLSLGTAFALLGHLSSYPNLQRGCLLLLALGILALNWKLITALLGQFAALERVHRSRVQQLGAVTLASFLLPVVLFALGRLL